ncbi:MAG: hypothetical protein IPF99_31150 [Deltaproteobacteria bacterium]|nr:hypothetical protein [Deltaproteobacteria bacterium]
MTVIEIPIDLSARDALALVQLLERIVEALWQAHEREMSETLEAMADSRQDALLF